MKNNGFTLIELMIVVAIIAIIAAFAMPSYREHIANTRRSEAAAALLTGAQALERYFSANGKYSLPDDSAFPAVFPTQVPANGTAYYTIAVATAVAPAAYTLRATRVAGGLMASDACGNLQIDHTGARTLDSATKTVAECWRR